MNGASDLLLLGIGVALIANVVASAVGISAMLRMAKESGIWQGKTDERLAGSDAQHDRHEGRLNAHAGKINDLEVGLAGHVGKGEGS